ncbi:MAG: hypothetical protein QOF48_935 [Verrucomicrobiota bacterium]
MNRALYGLSRGALIGAGLIVLVVVLFKLTPIPLWTVSAAAIAGGVCAFAGFVAGGWRKPGQQEIARWIDERQQLKERLSTALEMSGGAGAADWKELLVHDAARHAEALKPAELFPLRFPKPARWALAALVLAAGLWFVPEYRTFAHVQQKKEEANVKEVGKELADLARKELVQRPAALPAAQKAMEQVTELGDTLAKQSLTKAEALRNLATATEKLVKQEKEAEQNPVPKPLERAAREPGNRASASTQALQKQLDALQKAMGDAAAKADQLDKLSDQMQKIQQQAASMAANNSKMSSSDREQLAESLANMARQAQEDGASLEGLEDAIAALKANNPEEFVKDIEAASHDLEKLRQMAKSMQSVKQQMAKIGKDLGEQLDKGQAQAAVQTLQKMVEQLEQGNVTKEQLEQIMKEVAKAVDPAKDYGKVAGHLQKAAQQCQGGDKPGAGQSLAEAKKELQKMLDQMADSESMEAMIDALARADMAIRSGKMWSECQGGKCASCNGLGCGKCKGRGWSHGGKPGGGVGTWADEYGWTYFSENQGEPVDNSDIQRPDMPGHGHTERPADLNPNLVPDKVKGQVSPGGSMPSITLKGVSIKGTSKVKFEDAATTAQADAQSALNQDKVPRAYQNAVRDYFDDLKK